MGNLVQVKLKLRNSDSIRAMQQLGRVSPRCASHIVNKFCFQVARKVVIAMPEAGAGRVQSQLDAGGFARDPKATTWSAGIKAGELRHLSTAERIVVASIHPNSNFNRKTGGVWFRQNQSSPALHPARS